jgi:hypothetical protein
METIRAQDIAELNSLLNDAGIDPIIVIQGAQ